MDIYILEDNIIQQGRLEQALDKALRSYGETLDCVQTFEQSNQLLEYIKPANHQQLFFLAIEIKGKEKEGLHLGQTIRNKLPDAHIVFVTSHSEFMPLTFSYQLFALDYIDKNLDEDSFQSKVAIALSYVAKQSIKKEEKFSFHSGTDHIDLSYDRLLYIETSAKRHYVILHGSHSIFEFRANISDLANANPKLFRCHRSYLINPDKLVRLNKTKREIEMSDGTNCLVSRRHIKAVLAFMYEDKKI